MAYDVSQRPGAWVAAQVGRRRTRLLAGAVAYALVSLLLIWMALTRRLSALDSALILSLAFALRPRIEHSIDSYFLWERGAEAEYAVGTVLEELRRDGWVVMHDIDRPGEGNIDHLVSGPGGVFLIETKARRYQENDLAKARWRAAKLHDELGVWISPVIALADRRNPKVFEAHGVTVVPKQSLLTWLRGQRRTTLPFENLARWADQL